MTSDRVARLRQFCLTLCMLGTVWAAVLTLTHGFALRVGVIHIASRRPRNPAIAALLSGATAWMLATPRPAWRVFATDCATIWRRLALPLRFPRNLLLRFASLAASRVVRSKTPQHQASSDPMTSQDQMKHRFTFVGLTLIAAYLLLEA